MSETTRYGAWEVADPVHFLSLPLGPWDATANATSQ